MKKLIKRFIGQHKLIAILTLVIGCVSQAFGLDLAPAEVDVLVTAAATILAIVERRS